MQKPYNEQEGVSVQKMEKVSLEGLPIREVVLNNPIKPWLDHTKEESPPKYELRKLEIKEDLTMGERLYCVIEDVEDYIMHNNLEQDKELNFILKELETIKEIYDESNI